MSYMWLNTVLVRWAALSFKYLEVVLSWVPWEDSTRRILGFKNFFSSKTFLLYEILDRDRKMIGIDIYTFYIARNIYSILLHL